MCVGSGLLLAAALPPLGWWPLAFLGIAGLDRLLADRPAAERFRRGWLVFAALLFPTLIWMKALTLPGYLIASAFYATMFGAGAALCPPGRARWLALPGAIVLAELVRWSWPFGGVPLSTLAQGQVGGPLAPTVRVGGMLLLVGLAVTCGVAVSAALRRAWVPASVAVAVVVLAVAGAALAPRGHAIRTISVAAVQGGGPQGTRADRDGVDARVVFDRHLAASEAIETPVDLVVWPEDVVDVDGPIAGTPESDELAALARRLDTTLIAGVIESADVDGLRRFHNAAVVYLPDGTIGDRYEKVQRVPFGEYVPFRSLLEKVAGDALIKDDAIIGKGPAVVDTPVGRMGVVISWEVFFGHRGRDAIEHGGTVLLNPTNGSSFSGVLVQSQQIASSRLQALETGRWVVQAAPTGYSAIVTPSGHVVIRTDISERAVISGTIDERSGLTIATRIGDRPAVALAVLLVAAAWVLDRRRSAERDRSGEADRLEEPAVV
jgi:apolipoprotein N-acyltransferase